MSYQRKIIKMIEADPLRMKALKAAETLDLPEWLIAAGFVRNLVWNNVYNSQTELNDIDLIYYCQSDTSEERDRSLESQLASIEPDMPWSVKNQARMHLRNGDEPYMNTSDAMSHWPEKQTSVGVKLIKGKIEIRHCFDLGLLFNGQINRNPKRSIKIFKQRIESKGWLKCWPGLHTQK